MKYVVVKEFSQEYQYPPKIGDILTERNCWLYDKHNHPVCGALSHDAIENTKPIEEVNKDETA